MDPLAENTERLIRVDGGGCAAYSDRYQFSGTVTGPMFYIIGLGLADEKDITIKGLEVILNLILLIQLGSVLMKRLSGMRRP
jgi:hypothetical protein